MWILTFSQKIWKLDDSKSQAICFQLFSGNFFETSVYSCVSLTIRYTCIRRQHLMPKDENKIFVVNKREKRIIPW